MLHLIVIADPASLRYSFFQREVCAFVAAGHAEISLTCIDWRDLASDSEEWQQHLNQKTGFVRIESPGRDPSILMQLLRLGERSLNRLCCMAPESIDGWIIPPALVHAGLKVCLVRLEQAVKSLPNLTLQSSTEDILVAFDKNLTSERLAKATVPVPEFFRPSSVDEIVSKTMAQDSDDPWSGAFVKLAHGSCASGIIYLTRSDENPGRAQTSATTTRSLNGQTTILQRGDHFFNCYELQKLDESSAETFLKFLIEQGATAQRAVPRPMIGDRHWDLRVVVLYGRPIAIIPRMSRLPMTNLHLGGQRGDVEACRAVVGQRAWLDALDCASFAAAQFQLPCVGVDIAIHRQNGQPFALEVNAFGDFFPNWTDALGRSVHHLELLQLISSDSGRRNESSG